ncbi:MAG TPA: hypothetical protein PK002_01070 [Cellvibrio sp.]|nr:hypothetical protein [Cellvibrio sp.]
MTIFYSLLAFNEALKNKDAFHSANRNKEFWMVHNGSLWRTLFLYLGRLSDGGKDAKSFSDFNAHCIKNLSDFSKESFLKRRSDALLLNPDFLANAMFPDQTALNNLFSLASKYNGFLRAECKTIRNKVYAHAIYTEEHEYYELFKNVKYSEIENALLALWSVSKHLWSCFENARTINPIILPFSEKEEIYKSTLNILKGKV